MYDRITGGEFVSLIWLRKRDPLSICYNPEKGISYIPSRIQKEPKNFCYCGNKKSEDAVECALCESDIMRLVKQSALDMKVHEDLRTLLLDSDSISLHDGGSET